MRITIMTPGPFVFIELMGCLILGQLQALHSTGKAPGSAQPYKDASNAFECDGVTGYPRLVVPSESVVITQHRTAARHAPSAAIPHKPGSRTELEVRRALCARWDATSSGP
jgi:hypothetical protein